jgi:spoIIIJ-associated protein
MRELQREGKSVTKIIDDFLTEFGLQKEDVNYTVVDKGSKGFLSLWGTKDAVVKFFIPEEQDVLRQFLDGLLEKMDLEYQDMQVTQRNNHFNINIKGVDNPGFLIGKEGKMLNSIQHLLNRVMESSGGQQTKVFVNVDSYREKREDMIRSKVKSVVKKVQSRGKSVTVDQMNAADRRTAYRYLEKEPQLKTMTIGKGELKKIVVYPSTEEPKSKKNPKSS